MRILVPLDGSKYSQYALQEAVELAALSAPNKLTLLSVSEIMADLEEGQVILEKLEEVYQDALAKGKALADSKGVPVSTKLIRGESVAGEIVRAAEDENIDLIVIGGHGRKGLTRFLLGGTAAKVVANAPCNVTVVKRPRRA
jgi:nucleotide-binding universal stress UspA family protein